VTFAGEMTGSFRAPFLLFRIRQCRGVTIRECVARFRLEADARAAAAQARASATGEQFVVRRGRRARAIASVWV
jgi:hypothetical protein